jgi:hypothetical protein
VDNQDVHSHKEGANLWAKGTETPGDTAKEKLSRRCKTSDALVGCRHRKM